MTSPLLIAVFLGAVGTSVLPPPTDSLLLPTAAAMVRISSQCEEFWPGFWSSDAEFMLTRKSDERMLLVTSQPVPPEWESLLGDSVPYELLGRAYVRDGFPDRFKGFHVLHTLGDRTLPAVPAEAYSVEANIYMLIHEAFHGYQYEVFARPAERFAPASAAPRLSTVGLDRAEHGARAEVERQILAQVLDAPSEQERARLLERYLTMRELRMRLLPALLRIEQTEERIEGVAEWLGLVCAAANTDAPEDYVKVRLAHALAEPRPPLVGSLPVKWRAYGVGATLALVLEDLGVTWRQRVQQGAALDELLAEALRWDPTGLDADADRGWREEYGFSELLMELSETAPSRGTDVGAQ